MFLDFINWVINFEIRFLDVVFWTYISVMVWIICRSVT